MSPRITCCRFTDLLFGKPEDPRVIFFAHFTHVWPSNTPLCETFCLNCWHPYPCDFTPVAAVCVPRASLIPSEAILPLQACHGMFLSCA